MSEIIQVRVKANARDTALELQSDGTWLARIKAPPVDGKANAVLLSLIAHYFDVPKSKVSIKSGATARIKKVKVEK